MEDGGGTIYAREFAERRLKTDLYARTPGGLPVSTLNPPISVWMEYTDKDFPEGVPLPVIVPVTEPPSLNWYTLLLLLREVPPPVRLANPVKVKLPTVPELVPVSDHVTFPAGPTNVSVVPVPWMV